VPATPLSERAQGVDLSQPKAIYAEPNVDSIYAVQTLWQKARKNVNLVMILDTSGSMEGDKIQNARQAAIEFVEGMGENDYLSVVTFNYNHAITVVEYDLVGIKRQEIIAKIKALSAGGTTPLYDSIGLGAGIIARYSSSQTTNAMVILSDGLDTASTSYQFDDALVSAAIAHDTTIFTIAYGGDADQQILSGLAQKTNGNFYVGTETNILAVYQEMSAAFGGSQGIGR
jgi:Ca-activated chloride channel family protein